MQQTAKRTPDATPIARPVGCRSGRALPPMRCAMLACSMTPASNPWQREPSLQSLAHLQSLSRRRPSIPSPASLGGIADWLNGAGPIGQITVSS